jgi:hypothetical protein
LPWAIRSPRARLRLWRAAGNDRILSGIGDGAWRIAMGFFNGWRQPRNPADFQGLIFPSQAEAFEVFHHVEPEDGFQQPQAGPW